MAKKLNLTEYLIFAGIFIALVLFIPVMFGMAISTSWVPIILLCVAFLILFMMFKDLRG